MIDFADVYAAAMVGRVEDLAEKGERASRAELPSATTTDTMQKSSIWGWLSTRTT
jgi:hypothetical protein